MYMAGSLNGSAGAQAAAVAFNCLIKGRECIIRDLTNSSNMSYSVRDRKGNAVSFRHEAQNCFFRRNLIRRKIWNDGARILNQPLYFTSVVH